VTPRQRENQKQASILLLLAGGDVSGAAQWLRRGGASILGAVMISRKILMTAVAVALCGDLSLTATGASAAPASSPVIDGSLRAVSASSAIDAWAVGITSATPYLAEHWNGKKSSKVAIPVVSRNESLGSVSGLSATSAWAVGYYYSGSAATPLVVHWNGKAWSRISAPVSAGASSYLYGVKALSPHDAWAVGGVYPSSSYDFSSLILHWNGVSWKRVLSPSPVKGKYGNTLLGVTAISATSAWAVGCTDGCPTGGNPQIEHWNGTSWKQVIPPVTPFGLYMLTAVAATSADNIWAVGGSGPVTDEGAAIVHGNGRTWTLRGITNAALSGIAATSVSNAWAVGETVTATTPFTFHPLILHWNGKTWARS
jgi:hypothetical protein